MARTDDEIKFHWLMESDEAKELCPSRKARLFIWSGMIRAVQARSQSTPDILRSDDAK